MGGQATRGAIASRRRLEADGTARMATRQIPEAAAPAFGSRPPSQKPRRAGGLSRSRRRKDRIGWWSQPARSAQWSRRMPPPGAVPGAERLVERGWAGRRRQDAPPRRLRNAGRGRPLGRQAVRRRVRYEPRGAGAEQQRGTSTAWGKRNVKEEVLRAGAVTVKYAYQWQRKQRSRRRHRGKRPAARAVSSSQRSCGSRSPQYHRESTQDPGGSMPTEGIPAAPQTHSSRRQKGV